MVVATSRIRIDVTQPSSRWTSDPLRMSGIGTGRFGYGIPFTTSGFRSVTW